MIFPNDLDEEGLGDSFRVWKLVAQEPTLRAGAHVPAFFFSVPMDAVDALQ